MARPPAHGDFGLRFPTLIGLVVVPLSPPGAGGIVHEPVVMLLLPLGNY